MNDFFDVLPPLGFFAVVIIIVWIKLKYNAQIRESINKERMALIEKGVHDFPMEEVKTGVNLSRYMLWGLIMGLLLTGLGIALTIVSFISSVKEPDLIIPGLIFLFPGLGMLLFYKIVSKKEKEEKANSQPEQLTE